MLFSFYASCAKLCSVTFFDGFAEYFANVDTGIVFKIIELSFLRP